ncbi:MAG: hypothetical protein LWW85_12665 [Marinilabiliales bacterium]|nr:hypothetical protein [Marinilabiliales bacterium]
MKATYSQPEGMNNFRLGFAIGLLLPLLFFLMYFLFRFQEPSLGHFFQLLITTGKLVHVISLSVFPNLVPFMLFMRTDRFRAGRGVIASTLLYALTVVVLKLVI